MPIRPDLPGGRRRRGAVFRRCAGSWPPASFTHFDPVSPGVCRVLASVPGPEDFEIDAAHKVMFVSRPIAMRAKPAASDGIYFVKLDDPARRRSGWPARRRIFIPMASAFIAGRAARLLLAVNHHANGTSSIEIFGVSYDGGTPKLTAQSSIAGGLLVSPNDVFAVSPDQFYVTNDHVTRHRAGPLCRGLSAVAACRSAVFQRHRPSHRGAAHRLSQRRAGHAGRQPSLCHRHQ